VMSLAFPDLGRDVVAQLEAEAAISPPRIVIRLLINRGQPGEPMAAIPADAGLRLRSALRASVGEKLVADRVAAATDLCAETTLLMFGGVAVAFLRTGEAGGGTSFDHAADETDIRRALSYRDAAGELARVGAVESDSNYADQPPIVLAQADVGAGDTAGRAVETLLRTAQQNLTDQAPRQRMHADDLPKGHVDGTYRRAENGSGSARCQGACVVPGRAQRHSNIHGMELEGKREGAVFVLTAAIAARMARRHKQ
jgi:hypothetical protein